MPGIDPKTALTSFLTKVGRKEENVELSSDYPTNDVIRSQMFDSTVGFTLDIPFYQVRHDSFAKEMVSWERQGRQEAVISMGQLDALRKIFAGPEGKTLLEKAGLS
jgi:hypothetical protein